MTAPLRIAVFAHEFPALSETFVLNQITGLLDRGCDITVFAQGRRQEAVRHADTERYGLAQRSCYLAMPASRVRRLREAVGLFFRHRGRRMKLLRALNPLRYGREASSLKLFYWTVRLAAQDDRFDVIYCHFGLVGRTVAFLREIGAIQGRLVTVFHGVDVSACLRRTPALYRHLFANGDLFLPVSQHWQARLQAHGCDPGRIAVHHMGVDLARFAFRPRQPAGSGLRLLTVGRMVEKKGIDHALHAVAAARDRGVALRYTIVGDGPMRPALEALAEQLELRGIVRFLGACGQDQVVAHMYANEVLLAPSVTDRDGDQEGIPVTLMEAMASGMAVIASRHSGIPELVRSRETGLLAEERDVHGLAAAIAELAGDPKLRATLGRNGHELVAAEFDVAALNARLHRLLAALCGRPPAEDENPPRQDHALAQVYPARRSAG